LVPSSSSLQPVAQTVVQVAISSAAAMAGA